jgi:glycosyltransferase involved in cell wall biosynthesis
MTAIPHVSVGMPVYNGSAWVGAAIESVLAQTVADFELVIADNASTDDTETICRGYAERDSRVRYHRNPENIGVANNFNRAFTLSRAPFFKWISCSDLIGAEYLEKALRAYESHPDAILIYTGVRLFDEDPTRGVECHDEFDLDIDDPVERFLRYSLGVKLNNIMHGLFRSEALRRTRLYRNFLAADYNMIAELVLHGRVVQIPDVLHFRRMDKETFSSKFSDADLRRYYNPKQSGRMSFREWPRLADYCRIILHAPVAARQRLKLLAFLVKRTFWMRRDLLNEMAGRAAQPFRRGSH